MDTTATAPTIGIKLLEAHPDKAVRIEISNIASHPIRIWTGDYSWGWSNWCFEFFDHNTMIVYVRRPEQGFTVNIPTYFTIVGLGHHSLSFNLSDGTWVAHRIPIWPAYPSRVDKENAINGCFAVLAIPTTPESAKLSVWTGMTTSALH
jgi:hypothetical protein